MIKDPFLKITDEVSQDLLNSKQSHTPLTYTCLGLCFHYKNEGKLSWCDNVHDKDDDDNDDNDGDYAELNRRWRQRIDDLWRQ